ncbi:MAG: alkaline phosphatase family protein, partial [Sphingobacteriales bacterium]
EGPVIGRQIPFLFLDGVDATTFYESIKQAGVEILASRSPTSRALKLEWPTQEWLLYLAPAFLVTGMLALVRQLRVPVLRLGYLYTGIVFTGAFLICAADIPFYNHFLRRLDDTVMSWNAHAGFGLGMILQEKSYHLFILLFVVSACFYLFVLSRICRAHLTWMRKQQQRQVATPYWKYPVAFVLFTGLFLLGMRGRIEAKTPILAGAAFICDDPTINSLGLNPVFTLVRTLMDSRQPDNQSLQWIDDGLALKQAAAMLHADPALQEVSPIARIDIPGGQLAGRNVVLVMMESMSTAKMSRFGNPDDLTPFLDSLSGSAWSFDNIWSAGVHTYNGIYSTLMGHPALMKKHPMEQVTVPEIDGLPAILGKAGYQTMFFTTHDELFDNMSGFLSANGMDKIVGQKDYPQREVKSTMGVPDEFMFRFSIPVLNEAAAKGKPFFAAFMTGSDHDPIVIPTDVGYIPQHKEKYQQSANFADWSLRRFMQYASVQDWYQNTLFVFVADHGCNMGTNRYDVAFSYQHIPLVIFAPGFTAARSFDKLGLQTDIPATVSGLVLSAPYINLTFSTDLLQQQKEYAIFSCDNRLVCMSDSLMYVYRTGSELPGLYRYRNSDEQNYYEKDSSLALPMREAAFSWLQASQWVLANKKAATRFMASQFTASH